MWPMQGTAGKALYILHHVSKLINLCKLIIIIAAKHYQLLSNIHMSVAHFP